LGNITDYIKIQNDIRLSKYENFYINNPFFLVIDMKNVVIPQPELKSFDRY